MSAANSIVMLLIAGVVTASMRLWWLAVARWRTGQPLLEYEPREEPGWGLIDVLAAALLMILLPSMAVSASRITWARADQHSDVVRPVADLANDANDTNDAGTAGTAVGESPHDPRLILTSSVASLIACLLAIVLIAVRAGARIGDDLGLTFRHARKDLKLGLAAYAMLVPLVYVIQAILVSWVESKHPLTEMFREAPSWKLFVLAGFSAALIAPLSEEFLFRTMLQGWLERLAGGRGSLQEVFLGGQNEPHGHPPTRLLPREAATANVASRGATSVNDPAVGSSTPVASRLWMPIVVSAAIFAAMHASHGPDPIPLFVLALGLGYLYQRTHRLLPCIVLHALLNATTLAALGFAVWSGQWDG